MQKIVILTGAGISAESGIKTFRDADGLWENHDIMEVASLQGWARNRALVLEFYNQRRRQLKEVEPNEGHRALVRLEEKFETVIITQNIDDLHERAGSKHIIHLHGEITKVRSTLNPKLIYDWTEDLHEGDKCEKGSQLRPHIVWFGEEVPMLDAAARELLYADIIIIIGSSMQVYPAAGLVGQAAPYIPVYYIDPKPSINYELSLRPNLTVIEGSAATEVPKLVDKLLGDSTDG